MEHIDFNFIFLCFYGNWMHIIDCYNRLYVLNQNLIYQTILNIQNLLLVDKTQIHMFT